MFAGPTLAYSGAPFRSLFVIRIPPKFSAIVFVAALALSLASRGRR
jgi:hypothetical protein